jgi:imidazolonepropionase
VDDLVIRNGKVITTASQSPKICSEMNDLGIIDKGVVSVKDGKISYVGEESKDAEYVIDAEEGIVMPGFVDPHTHLVFAGTREDEFELRLKGENYQEIAKKGGGINSTVKATRKASKDELISLAKKRLDYALEWGTTTMEVKSGYGLNLEDEIKMLEVMNELDEIHSISIVPTFLGAHAFPEEQSREEYIDTLLNEAIPKAKDLAKFCDVFCETGFFTPDESRQVLERGKQFGMKPKIHADELNSSGGSEVAGEVGAISADHLVHPSDRGLNMLKEAGTIAVLLPGTTFFLDSEVAPARKIMDYGIPIAVGSDFNPGSCTILAMPIIIGLACLVLGLTPAEALISATINAAYSIGLGERIGSLEVGKDADIIVLNVKAYQEIPYWFGHNPVSVVIKQGKIVYKN